MPQFVENVEEIRQRASRKIEEGAVTDSYKGDVKQTISILNEALATEIVCVLRYMHHYFMATGVHGKAVSDEFKEHADAEREHADRIAERIQQLGGKPDYNPRTLLQRSASQYIEGETLADMIKEDLIAERIVIEVYQKMIRHFGDDDPTTRVMIEDILSDEEEHASDLADLLYIVNPESGETEGEDPGTHPLDLYGDRKQQQPQQSSGSGQKQGKPANRQQQSQEESAEISDVERALPQSRGLQRQQGRGAEQQQSKGNQQQRNRPSQQGRNEPPAQAAPGTTGRTMNRRGNRDEVDDLEVASRPNAGAQEGGTRSPKILEKNRKKRVA